MNEILKKLPELDRKSIKNALEMIRKWEQNEPNMKQIPECLRWRIYGIADILLNHQIINVDEYCVLIDASKWGL